MPDRPKLTPGPDHPITVTADGEHVVARAGDTVVADTTHALTLREAGYPPVYYLPVGEIDPALLRDGSASSYCPYKGEASYYSLALPDGELSDIGWYYPEPFDAVGEIAGHVAFYADRVTVSAAD